MVFTGDYFDNYRLADLNDLVLQQAQQKLNVQLPDTYIALMKQQNGGELTNKKLLLNGEEIVVDYLNGIGCKSGEGILLTSTIKREWGLSNKLVYLHGDSHTWIALDYRRYKGSNPPVVYIDIDSKKKHIIAPNFQEFMEQLIYDESLTGSSYSYGDELTEFSREYVEEAMKKCQDAYLMSAGIEYYSFTDKDLTWVFSQILNYANDFIKEGYEPYKRPQRDGYMLDEFLNCIIAIIRQREVDLRNYDVAMELLNVLLTFPPDYDDQGMIQNKARKIVGYYDKGN